MKRHLLAGLLPLLILAGLSAQEPDPAQYKIGDRGPGGGIIFSISQSTVWEVGELLGHMTWDRAYRICTEYHIDSLENWYLPSKDELESIYYNLVKPGLLHDKETYWSSNQEESMALWGYNFKKGRPGLYGAARRLAVRPVRHFEIE